MHIDVHLETVFSQIKAGVNVSYLLYVRVEAAAVHEHAIRVLVKNRVCDTPYTIDLSPWFPVPFELRWLMPNAKPTCDLFYVAGVDRNLNGTIVSSHVQRMLETVESEIKRSHPECGRAWRLTFMVTKPFLPESSGRGRGSAVNVSAGTTNSRRIVIVESDPSSSSSQHDDECEREH